MLTVIYNPKSGTTNSLDDIKAAFAHHGVQPTYLPVGSRLLHRHVKAETAKRGAVIIAAGGDGTISSVARLVRGTTAKFGVIPTGSSNHFAQDLSVPLDINDAVRVIIAGKTVAVDAAQANGHVFVNNASIGLYPLSLRHRAQYDGRRSKWSAALLGVLRVLAQPRRYRVTLTLDGKHITRRTPFVCIGNNQYILNKPPFLHRDALNNGALGIYIIKAGSVFSVVRMFVHALFTRKRRTAEFETYQTNEVRVTANKHRTLHVAYDGEIAKMGTPLKFKILPKALRVIVP